MSVLWKLPIRLPNKTFLLRQKRMSVDSDWAATVRRMLDQVDELTSTFDYSIKFNSFSARERAALLAGWQLDVPLFRCNQHAAPGRTPAARRHTGAGLVGMSEGDLIDGGRLRCGVMCWQQLAYQQETCNCCRASALWAGCSRSCNSRPTRPTHVCRMYQFVPLHF